MDFGALPPEVNSGRMYSGPGPESMLAAATAWDRLAAGLYDQATEYQSVTAKLADGWGGSAATTMTSAVTPYTRWLTGAAGHAEQAAAQAREAVRAHETAYAAMVPPPLIDANRALRASLASTNHLGQTSASIADADAEYERMWAQDANAMYAYAGSSATAATVTPFPSPPSSMDPAGLGYAESAMPDAEEVIAAGSQLIPALPNALRSLSSSRLSSSPLASVLPALAKLRTLRLGFAKVAKAASAAGADEAVGGTVSAGFSRGTPVGNLSVPREWLKGTMVMPAATPLQRRGWVCEVVVDDNYVEPPLWPLAR